MLIFDDADAGFEIAPQGDIFGAWQPYNFGFRGTCWLTAMGGLSCSWTTGPIPGGTYRLFSTFHKQADPADGLIEVLDAMTSAVLGSATLHEDGSDPDLVIEDYGFRLVIPSIHLPRAGVKIRLTSIGGTSGGYPFLSADAVALDLVAAEPTNTVARPARWVPRMR